MLPIPSQLSERTRSSPWLVVSVAVVLFALGIVGTVDTEFQRSGAWSMSSDLLDSDAAMLEFDSLTNILDRAAKRHDDHRASNAHESNGCGGVDCSATIALVLRDSKHFLPEFPSSADPGTPIARLVQPPLRPPRISV